MNLAQRSIIKVLSYVPIPMHWLTSKQVFFVFFLSFSSLAQQTQNFTGFGYVPAVVPDSLYHELVLATTTTDSLNAMALLGAAHYQYGNADSVAFYGMEIERLVERGLLGTKGNSHYLLKAKRLQGDSKYLRGIYDGALKNYLEGLNIGEDGLYDPEINGLKLGLASVYFKTGLHEKSQKILNDIIAVSKDLMMQAKANYLLGKIAGVQQDFAKSEAFYAKAQSLISPKTHPKFYLELTLDEGILVLEQKKYSLAIVAFDEVMTKSMDFHFYDLYTDAVLNYGTGYIGLEEFDAAEMVLSMAYANAINWNRLGIQLKIINALRKLYATKGDFQNAYNLMTQFNNVWAQISKEENTQLIRDLEFKYESVQKENEIWELQETQRDKQNEIERQKTIKKAFLYGFLVILIPIIGLLYVYYQKLQTQSQLNLQQKELNTRSIAALLKEQELKLAMTSLEAQQEERLRIAQQLHDGIGGNLAGIKLQLSNMQDKSSVQQGIMKQVNETYELVRDISHVLIPKKITQNAFSILVKEHMHQIEQHSNLSISFYAHPEEKIDGLPEPLKVELFQIIQELTTNTLKHANASSIELHISFFKEQLQVLFEDDGEGFDSAKVASGIGLDNIENRVRQLHGQLTIDSTVGRGTAITITLTNLHEKI